MHANMATNPNIIRGMLSLGMEPPLRMWGMNQMIRSRSMGRAAKGATIAPVRFTNSGKLVKGKQTSAATQKKL